MPITKKHFITILLLPLMATSSLLYAKNNNKKINTGQAFSRPLKRFDIRIKDFEINDNRDDTILIARVDRPIKFENNWLLNLRLDLPYIWSREREHSCACKKKTQGISDILFQCIAVIPPKGKWVVGLGGRIIFPTARKDKLGTGKYIFAPALAVHYDWSHIAKGAWVEAIWLHSVDIGGKKRRANIDITALQPRIHFLLPRNWFIESSPVYRYNWATEEWHVPVSILIGKLIGKRMIVTLEYQRAAIRDFPIFKQQIEFRVGFFY